MAIAGYDCQAWGGFVMALQHANAIKHFEAVDQIEIAMNRLATSIMADPRRVTAVQSGCSKHFSDIQRRGQAGAVARQIPDPSHDPALMEGWMKSVPDDLLSEIIAAAKSEIASRKAAKAKKK